MARRRTVSGSGSGSGSDLDPGRTKDSVAEKLNIR